MVWLSGFLTLRYESSSSFLSIPMARDSDYPQAVIPGARQTDSAPRLTLYPDLNRVRIVIPENNSEWNFGPERSTHVELDALLNAVRDLAAHRA